MDEKILLNSLIEYSKDSGDYQNNIGFRSSELSKIKIRISDIVYNNSLFIASIQQQLQTNNSEHNEVNSKILNKLIFDSENLKSLEESLDAIITLINDDTNSAKHTTRSIIKQLESYKEANYVKK